jgi:hypothetical protein
VSTWSRKEFAGRIALVFASVFAGNSHLPVGVARRDRATSQALEQRS